MQHHDKEPNTFETSGTSPPLGFSQEKPYAQPQPEITAEERKSRRTLGLKLFDVLLYPLLTNFAVFSLSVTATYLTTEGHRYNNWFSQTMFKRGEWFKSKLEPHLGANNADMAKMVFFSWFDGTLFAPIVKFFEDRREKIGKWLDGVFGTTPQDLSVYDAEPKQTWGSVILGRLATASLVVPVAATLGKVHVKKDDGFATVNDAMFGGIGNKFGNWLSSKSSITKRFPTINMHEIGKISAFEAFYTTVCTGGLYMFSRMFARRHDQKIGRIEHPQTNASVDKVVRPADAVPPAANDPMPAANDAGAPSTQVRAGHSVARLDANAVSQAVNA